MNTNDNKNNQTVHTDTEEVVMEPIAGAAEADASDDMLDDSVVAEESAQETIKKLREKIKKLTAEKQEYLDGWQRTNAESVNARKREDESRAELRKFASQDIIEEILPVLQSFEMAFANKESWEKVDKNWRAGVEYIANQLKSTLEARGLAEVDPIGKPFDAARDEAVEYVPTTKETEDNLVLKVIQKGYTLHGKIIRAPKVHVGEYSKNKN